jgi:GT2 family glycosyltransferase
MNLFGMITTAASRDYTPVALRSFLASTPAEQCARFILVDNDGDFALPADLPADRITLIRHTTPQGFAANANLLLAHARELGADLFLLNNDLVFTSGWLEPLLANRRALLSPVSNAEAAHTSGLFAVSDSMDLADYIGHEAELENIARRHAVARDVYHRITSVAFFCIKIPRAVYEVVGDFDERFGTGGEDRDYTLRALIAGIPQELALGSYVLHFQGKSTWRGPETAEKQRQRTAFYTAAFEQKWGPALRHAFIGCDWNLFRSDARLARLIDRGEFTRLARHLRSYPAIDAFVARQRAARFAAVCCVYDDDTWLAPAIESVYDVSHSIVFLVSDTPWNGEAADQGPVLARIRALPDPAGKIRIVEGRWPDEAAQRNEGLRLVADAGIEYCFVLDADEIYDPGQLQRAMAIVRENPQVDCWRSSCFTYWKSYRHRVDPPEDVTAAVFVRTGTGRFVENRSYQAERQLALPASIVAFHHMSYARTDAQILRKITTFGHARDVVPGWYENVWRKWDEDRSLRNLNPCWPGAYQRIVDQPYEALPPVIRRMWDAEAVKEHVHA